MTCIRSHVMNPAEPSGNETKFAGEFSTPRPIIRFMVAVIDPQLGEAL